MIQIDVQIHPFPSRYLQLEAVGTVIVDVANVGQRESVAGRVLSGDPFMKYGKLDDWIDHE